MRIFDIDIYRDGGSIEFFIERDGETRQIWLETPVKGEPRAFSFESRRKISRESLETSTPTKIKSFFAIDVIKSPPSKSELAEAAPATVRV